MNNLAESLLESETIDAFVVRIASRLSEIESHPDKYINNQWIHEKIVLEQYTTCVRFLSDFFRFVPWQYWEENWIGNCDITTAMSETGISGPFEGTFFRLRNELSLHSLHACEFHRENVGCVLGGLKSPRCVTHQIEIFQIHMM
jgi:hypothetical protein